MCLTDLLIDGAADYYFRDPSSAWSFQCQTDGIYESADFLMIDAPRASGSSTKRQKPEHQQVTHIPADLEDEVNEDEG